MSEILELLRPSRSRFLKLQEKIEAEDASTKPNYLNYLKEHGRLLPMMELFNSLEATVKSLDESRSIIEDEPNSDIAELAYEEIPELEEKLLELEDEVLSALLASDEDSSKNAIVEIRAGVGGDEAAIFTGDMFRMYSNYAITKKWKIDVLSVNYSEMGGFKEIVFNVKGEGAYQILTAESGGHRVQRVPATESMGRVHTSAITIAVLPEVKEVEVQINPADLRIDTYRASGAGGQHVNTTDSAVRITHIPTGIVVTSQDEKSQIQNRAKCEKYLRAKIYDEEKRKSEMERGALRKGMIGSGDRSERIRTYNYPQNRVTDHRANITLYHLDRITEGEMDDLIDAIQKYLKTQLMENLKKNTFEDL